MSAEPNERLRCSKCGVASIGWLNTEVGCDDCGSHSALECPVCGEIFDAVYWNDDTQPAFIRWG